MRYKHEMQYVKPCASDQHLASYNNRKGYKHTLLYSVKYLQYMLKILHYSHQTKHSVQLCTMGSKELLYHIPLGIYQPIKFKNFRSAIEYKSSKIQAFDRLILSNGLYRSPYRQLLTDEIQKDRNRGIA